jgi:hypothetical protein
MEHVITTTAVDRRRGQRRTESYEMSAEPFGSPDRVFEDLIGVTAPLSVTRRSTRCPRIDHEREA